MLKFEALAKIGETIKAFDFQSMPGRPDRFIIGRVLNKGIVAGAGYAAYEIEVTEDSEGVRTGATCFVPFEVSIMEYDNRVQLVRGDFTYYAAGSIFGQQLAQTYYMFTCWNAAHTSCGCHSVTADQLAGNIAALEKSGYINRTAGDQRWDFAARTWVKAA